MKKNKTTLFVALALAFLAGGTVSRASASESLISHDTGLTLTKVRTAKAGTNSLIVASSYEGTLLAMTYSGQIGWKNELSGFMNRDIWCADLNGDNLDEILAANADGSLYCLDARGKLKWKFKPSDAPMNAVCVIHKNGKPYVVCGGYDKNIYYLSPKGKLLKTIHSNTYSKEKPWGKIKRPPNNTHIANFIRPLKQADGSEHLVVHGSIYSNSATGQAYLFEPLADTPYKMFKLKGGVGELRTVDINGDGNEEFLTGATSMIQDAKFVSVDPESGEQQLFNVGELRRKIDGFGYRVLQPELISENGDSKYFILFGSRIILLPLDMNKNNTEVIACKYAFNDMWKDPVTGKFLFASSQSGGSCVHILDPNQADWKEAYAKLTPPGKIATILKNTAQAREQLEGFQKPDWERKARPVYFISESRKGSGGPYIKAIEEKYDNPTFLNYKFTGLAENWDRSSMGNEFYKSRRDRRRKYTATQQQCLDTFLPCYENMPGLAFWGGHGNDPYMYSLDTKKKLLDGANGKKTVMIFPELESHSEDFASVLDEHIYPLAKYMRNKNANFYVRTKHTFWQSIIYMPMWSRLISGEFADVFVPSMEETTDKSMELSVAGRMGIWASGAVDNWGARSARDNASFDRMRQHSHQMLPNHFLRQMVYNISLGATYLNNFSVNQSYTSLLWELIAKGALFVPERNEIVSFNPVYLGMTEPDEHYLQEGNNCKWMTFFDQAEEAANPMVFSRLNGTWPGAPVTEWDFSRYAAGVKERRLNFIPPYKNGLVMIAPVQHGTLADPDAPRGAMIDKLHPMYKNIMKEYVTNGRDYLSANGKKTYAADKYYKKVEQDILAGAKKLPVTVSGDVAWVCAQTSPTHLRLTLIDSGYINPENRTATVTFNTVSAVKMTDLLSGETFTGAPSVNVDVPCGLFRFIDIELTEAF